MNSCELVTFISSAACALSRCSDRDDLALMATVFTQLGDTLQTILAHDEICERRNSDESEEEKAC